MEVMLSLKTLKQCSSKSNNFITAYLWNEWQIGKPGFSLVINSLMKILDVICCKKNFINHVICESCEVLTLNLA